MTMNCYWKGLKSDFKLHAKAKHLFHFSECSELEFETLWVHTFFLHYFGILSCYGYLFTYCKPPKDGRFYSAVQLIGTSSEVSKYKCKFTLRAKNGIEEISKTFLIRSYVKNWEKIYNSGKCLNLDEETVRKLLVLNEVSLTITLSRV
jgi:hypothetical protein